MIFIGPKVLETSKSVRTYLYGRKNQPYLNGTILNVCPGIKNGLCVGHRHDFVSPTIVWVEHTRRKSVAASLRKQINFY